MRMDFYVCTIGLLMFYFLFLVFFFWPSDNMVMYVWYIYLQKAHVLSNVTLPDK